MRRRFMMQGKGTIKPYMHIEALEDGLTVTFSMPSGFDTGYLYYSLDGSTWVTLPANTASPAINTGEKIYFKGMFTPISGLGIGNFSISKKCNVGGNVMSLLFGDDFQNKYSLSQKESAFSYLFDSCDTIISVSDNFLPATVLYYRCYHSMFYGCSNLIKAPELPATTLDSNCYNSMFYGCTSLVNAPKLPAKTLISNCYHSMFYGCSSLSYIEAMFTTIPSGIYTNNWVYGVSSSGTFVKNKDATWNVTGANGIPSGWTVITE